MLARRSSQPVPVSRCGPCGRPVSRKDPSPPASEPNERHQLEDRAPKGGAPVFGSAPRAHRRGHPAVAHHGGARAAAARRAEWGRRRLDPSLAGRHARRGPLLLALRAHLRHRPLWLRRRRGGGRDRWHVGGLVLLAKTGRPRAHCRLRHGARGSLPARDGDSPARRIRDARPHPAAGLELPVSPSDERTARNVYLVLAIAFGMMSAFWVFYSVRLLTVTRGLQGIRPGGQGAYVGAVVFPALAL